MRIASYPPNTPRPTPQHAARHINEEARLVLASLRGGPPYVARGELALGLRELRAFVRGRFLDANNNASGVVGLNNAGGDYYSTSHSNLGSAAVAAASAAQQGEGENDNDETNEATAPQVRMPPPPSPTRGGEGGGSSSSGMVMSKELQMKTGLPPPPLPAGFDELGIGTQKDIKSDGAAVSTSTVTEEASTTNNPEQGPMTPPASPTPTPVSISTPHSVPPTATSLSPDPTPPLPLMPGPQNQQHQQQHQQQLLDPGPYAAPFLAVIVDPRAAGPHTLVALRALHRLLDRGSIVQLTRCGGTDANKGRQMDGEAGPHPFAHETALEPIARGVLACRFEQTDAGADEAVEMAIADLLKLLVELDAAGARAAEAALLRQVYMSKRAREQQQQQQQQQAQKGSYNNQTAEVKRRSSTMGAATTIKIQRLPSAILMESFHAVFITRRTFVQNGGGHHSPALSFHFEQVLMRMIHCVFGGEDAQSTLKGKGRMTSGHVLGARKIMEFLIDSLTMRGSDAGVDDKWNRMMDGSDDGRTLCLRLIQCFLRTGWGGSDTAASSDAIKDAGGSATQSHTAVTSEEDRALLRLIEDDLCLALLTAGQAIWAHHDEIPSGSAASSSSSGGDMGPSGTSLELLSEVCATLSLLWSLPKLRRRLRSQFESIFSGFYQRALSLLRRRPLPEDGVSYQANMIFDMEVEVILESLVDILCLGSSSAGVGVTGGSNGGAGGNKSLSTIEELFLTYDCSLTESDIASSLLVELSRCCGGVVDEEGEPYLPSMPLSRASTSGAPTPSNDADSKGGQPMLIARHRSVPDHLKELCFEALLGSLRRLFHGAESLRSSLKGDETDSSAQSSSSSSSLLRTAKNKKRRLHHAAGLFNEKPRKGLQYLVDHGMLPSPATPESVASFLRNGLVVGLNKAAVGQYLGEVGKKDEDAVIFERDWFHKELLLAFCSSFGFEHQTVLDGLRMFLATFRLPGEAQMIDRILQAFSESIARQCEEGVKGSLKLFSPDEKRASDAAYLLSFSIIMLNTDLHNENIRADRKMKLSDFIRNNKNYGKEISDKDLPSEYLEGIYSNIKQEQIRTLGEGADGSMTVERWKDVMRSAHSFQSQDIKRGSEIKDLKELLLESSWHPILSAVSGLWGMVPLGHADVLAASGPDQLGSMLGARLGIDLAYEMLSGSSNLSRPDIFQDLFTNICYMSGLLGDYKRSNEERTDNFINSIEHQSALTVAVNIAEENGDLIGLDGWKCVWAMLFELRDLQLLSGRRQPNIMKESDPDLLSPDARIYFSRRMANWDDDFNQMEGQSRKGMSLMSFVFGSSESLEEKNDPAQRTGFAKSPHGKEGHLIWDDLASSDEEDENSDDTEFLSFPPQRSPRTASIGASFENQLVYESSLGNDELGVTGLERLDISASTSKSLRARVRQRLSQLIDFYGLIAESRYLSEEGLSDELNSLVEIIRDSSKKASSNQGSDNDEALVGLPLSPASEAFAEILLCEVALKNRDRFALVWNTILRAHYNSRLTYRPSRGENGDEEHQPDTIKLTAGTEKCITGILRLCVWTSNRNVIANEVLSMLKILHPPCTLIWSPVELNIDKHLSEGLWRIVRNVDGLSQIDDEGWSGILGLAEWCATRGGLRSQDQLGSLAEDDPSLQAFRSIHLILHAVELKDSLQVDRLPQIVRTVRCLVEAGERAFSEKLSIAGLDLLQVLHTRMESLATKESNPQHLLNCWVPVLEAISEPAEKSRNGSVRQQAISLLTDTLLDRHGSLVPVDSGLYEIMNSICIPLADKRITDLLRIPYDMQNDLDETLIELELCISLLFKPFLHHLKALVSVKQEFMGIWISILGIMTQLLGEGATQTKEENGAEGEVTRAKLFNTTKELASEHLRNAVMVLAAMGVLLNSDGDSKSSDSQEISSVTWAAIGSIGYCKPYLDEWKTACE